MGMEEVVSYRNGEGGEQIYGVKGMKMVKGEGKLFSLEMIGGL